MDILLRIRYTKFMLLILLWPVILAGQTDSLSNDNRSLPVLNDHYFIPSSYFPSPFITTFMKSGLGGSESLTSIPIYSTDGDSLLGTVDGENTFVIVDVHFQAKVIEWLAFWLRYQAYARVGTTAETVLAQGVTAVTASEIGLLFGLWQTEKLQLSATIAVNNGLVKLLGLDSPIEEVFDDPRSANFRYKRRDIPFQGKAGIHFAYAFNHLIGVNTFVNALYGQTLQSEEANVRKFNFGLLVDFNFNRHYDIPFGCSLGYTRQKFAPFQGQTEEELNMYIFKVAYTGREEYILGLELAHNKSSTPFVVGDYKISYLTALLSMVYYF